MKFRLWNMVLVLVLILGNFVVAPMLAQAQEGQNLIMLPMVMGERGSSTVSDSPIVAESVETQLDVAANEAADNTSLNAANLMSDVEVRDFLVEDECVAWTGSSRVVDPADPRCTYHTNIGTTAKYYRTDKDSYQAMHAYSRRDYLGNERIVSTMDFRQPSTAGLTNLAVHEMNYDLGGSQWMRDGGNYIEYGGFYASFVGTQDGAGQQTFYGKWSAASSACSFVDDAWILFGRNVNASVSTVTNYQNINTCINAGHTVTNYWRGLYTYGDGKTLDTIISEHFTGTAMERQFFTKEYGHTKFEAWRQNETPASHPHCAGSYTSGGGWVRTDCREWTIINPMPSNRPHGYNLLAYGMELPLNEWTSGAVFATTNVLANGDAGFHNTQYWTVFGAGASSVTATKKSETIGSGVNSFVNENWTYKFNTGQYGYGPSSLGSIRPIVWSTNKLTLRFGLDVAREYRYLTGSDLQFRVEIFNSNGAVVASSGLKNCSVDTAIGFWDRCEVAQTFNVTSGNLYPALYIEKNDSQARFDVDDIFVVVE